MNEYFPIDIAYTYEKPLEKSERMHDVEYKNIISLFSKYN